MILGPSAVVTRTVGSCRPFASLLEGYLAVYKSMEHGTVQVKKIFRLTLWL